MSIINISSPQIAHGFHFHSFFTESMEKIKRCIESPLVQLALGFGIGVHIYKIYEPITIKNDTLIEKTISPCFLESFQ